MWVLLCISIACTSKAEEISQLLQSCDLAQAPAAASSTNLSKSGDVIHSITKIEFKSSVKEQEAWRSASRALRGLTPRAGGSPGDWYQLKERGRRSTSVNINPTTGATTIWIYELK
jgi:hypothetical protein